MHVVGTAGHVDHGKSALVRALTGIDPDRLEEEKRRGLTIDLGFAWCTLPSGREMGIVDVPGHERFIRNMLSGVGGIAAAILVVAADEGFKPQSAEHLQVLDFLEVSSGVVALTKTDLAEAETTAHVRREVEERLRGTSLEAASIVEVSSVTGAGLDELRSALDDVLARTPPATDRGRPRLFVDRSFTIPGAGTVVTGTLTGGSLRTGADVEVLPSGLRARIRSLQTHSRAVDEASPGSRVAANLVGAERGDVARGDAVVAPGTYMLTDTFAARLRTAHSLRHELTERGAYELHSGSAEVSCRLKLLDADRLGAQASALAQLYTGRPLPLEVGDRFVVRDVGRRFTVAGGVVLDTASEVIRRGYDRALERLRARVGLERTELARRVVSERGVIHSDDLQREAGLGAQELASAIEGLVSAGRHVLDPGFAADLEHRAGEVLRAYHDEHPLDPGMPRDAFRAELGLGAGAEADLIGTWTDVVVDGSAVRRRGQGLGLGSAERETADAALGKLRAGGASPPGLGEVGLRPELAKALERAGELVLIAPDIGYPSDVWDRLVRRVSDLIRDEGVATVSRIRQELGTSRKYAVPLLERLDAEGITRRKGDVRELGPRAG